MRTPHLDILKRGVDGSFIWIETVTDLESARNRLKTLAAGAPGEYFVFDHKQQQIVATTAYRVDAK
jgi:hypothetical protein